MAITGINSVKLGCMCFTTSFISIFSKEIYLGKNGNKAITLTNVPNDMINVYIAKSDCSLTKTKINIAFAILITVFLVTVNLNFSIPKKNQFISKPAEITYKN